MTILHIWHSCNNKHDCFVDNAQTYLLLTFNSLHQHETRFESASHTCRFEAKLTPFERNLRDMWYTVAVNSIFLKYISFLGRLPWVTLLSYLGTVTLSYGWTWRSGSVAGVQLWQALRRRTCLGGWTSIPWIVQGCSSPTGGHTPTCLGQVVARHLNLLGHALEDSGQVSLDRAQWKERLEGSCLLFVLKNKIAFSSTTVFDNDWCQIVNQTHVRLGNQIMCYA